VLNSFRAFAHSIAEHVGRPMAFICAVLVVVGWAAVGPFLEFSTTWQLFINSFTTIVTFLMVFLIQATQNRDSRELHLKLDELLRTQKNARKRFENLEEASDEELKQLEAEFRRVRSRHRRGSAEHSGDQ
jgi:low affinity Fe/Cu permease